MRIPCRRGFADARIPGSLAELSIFGFFFKNNFSIFIFIQFSHTLVHASQIHQHYPKREKTVSFVWTRNENLKKKFKLNHHLLVFYHLFIY